MFLLIWGGGLVVFDIKGRCLHGLGYRDQGLGLFLVGKWSPAWPF